MKDKAYKEVLEKIREYAEEHEKKSRYEHSVRVAEMCEKLCLHYGLDEKIGYLVGIAHDICKDMDYEKMMKTAAKDGNEIIDYEKKKPALLHGRAAAVLLKEKFGIEDKDILEAVANHTSGVYGMCDLTKCLFLADKIEPGRPQSTEEYRNRYLSMTLDEMTGHIILENYEYIKAKGYEIYPGTDKMVEYFKKVLEKKN